MTLAKIIKKDLCVGCGLCAFVGAENGQLVSMELNEHGFLRPVGTENLAPDVQKDLAAACPGARLDLHADKGARQTILWGPIKDILTGHSTDPEIRQMGSSGGGLSALLMALVQAGEVEGVVHVSADAAKPTHSAPELSINRKGIVSGAGSRYAPASPVAGLTAGLARFDRVAFVGKPCDVAAVRQWMRKDKALRKRIPYLISFMCGGTPSQNGTSKIIAALHQDENKVTSFRYRGDGWPGGVQSVTDTGETATMSYPQSWGDILSKHVQFRCKVCPDGNGGFADIVFADAWYGDERGYPLFDEADGRSMIIVRTEQGAKALALALDAKKLETQPLDEAAVLQMQPYQARRKALSVSRLLAMWVWGRRPYRVRGLNLIKAMRFESPKSHVKSFLGLLRRFAQGKA